jgi:hypothetical protein
MRRLLGRPLLFFVGLGALVVGFLIDMGTDRHLVVAITYAIPIALSAFAFSRSLTLTLMVVALLLTVVAGIQNARAQGVEEIAVLNRAMAALSFTLVGVFVLLNNRSTRLVRFLKGEGERANLEADLRHFLTSLSHAETQADLLQEAAQALHEHFGATRVCIIGMRNGKFTAPSYSYPSPSGEFKQGRRLPWMADAFPNNAPRVISTWYSGVQVTAGQLCAPKQDLLVLIERPTRGGSTRHLGEVLEGLEPLLGHAAKLERVKSPPASETPP